MEGYWKKILLKQDMISALKAQILFRRDILRQEADKLLLKNLKKLMTWKKWIKKTSEH